VITGHSPRIKWRKNPAGQRRTIQEAIGIAKGLGIQVPADVEFFVDEWGWLSEDTTARGPKITKVAGGIVGWSDHLNTNGKVPFIIHPRILDSDEAIVAVFAHEMHELQSLRPLLDAGKMSIEEV
jgi:hypothetical protein